MREVPIEMNVIKTKDINIIDLSKESFELLEELSMVINYYIPLTDNANEIDLVIKTIKIIKEFSAFDPKIYLVLNKCNSLDKNTIEKQFIGLFGDEKLGIKSRTEELNVDNIFYIPTSKIFSVFSLTKTNLLDYLNKRYMQTIKLKLIIHLLNIKLLTLLLL